MIEWVFKSLKFLEFVLVAERRRRASFTTESSLNPPQHLVEPTTLKPSLFLDTIWYSLFALSRQTRISNYNARQPCGAAIGSALPGVVCAIAVANAVFCK